MSKLVAGAFLSVAFERLFEKLTSQEFMNFLRGKRSIDDQLKLLNLKLKKVSLLLSDAEERQLDEPNVKEWLDEVKDAIYRAQDLVDDIDYEAQRSKHEPESESFMKKLMKSKMISNSEFDKAVQGEIAKILNDLNLLLDNGVSRGLKVLDAYRSSCTTVASSNILLEEDNIHGRTADKEAIMKLLLSNDVWGGEIGVLPIVGMGGLGKTTLAQLVYNDDRWKEREFAVNAWVAVSTDFDVSKIMKSILQQVSPNSIRGNEEKINTLQHALTEVLRGKKFLLVLDDVWNEDYKNWDYLRTTFRVGEHASRIIVTTRSLEVASIVSSGPIYELLLLSDDHCWRIFLDHAFGEDSIDEYPDLLQIGKRLVEKCKGLPLAVKSLGSLLRFEKDPTQWVRILRSHVWNWRNDILPSLWLTYLYLPAHLKQCFAYCSVFPKDYEFHKEKMILLWMAEGFLQSNIKRMEEAGKEYFDTLVSKSLFQRSSQDKSKFVMHNLVHDLAMFVAGEFCLAADDDENLELLTSKTRHFSVIESVESDSVRDGLSRAKHLRTMIGPRVPFSSNELTEEFLAAKRSLRVLSLQDAWLSLLPESIGNLKHLRYLDISCTDIKEIPRSICTLYNLQTLLLSNCRKLTRLPNDMGTLIKLRHLDTSGSPIEKMPPRMGNLSELQTLTDFVLGERENASSIKELGKLKYLSGKLCISGLQNVINLNDILEANLRRKENLTELTFKWQRDITETKRDMEVLGALQPHTNLETLTICSYGGLIFPNWIGDSLFSNVVSIHLRDNKYCWALPSLGQLPSLRELVIKGFHGVETIDAEFYGNNSSITPFKSLQTLCFHDMSEWKQWSFIGGERGGGVFPSLKQLSLIGCPYLTGSLPDLPRLETLEIVGSYSEYFMRSLPFDQLTWTFDHSYQNFEFPGSHCYQSMRELKIGQCDSLKSLPLDYFPVLEKLILADCWNLESLTFLESSTTKLQLSLSFLVLSNCRNLRALPQYMHRILPSLAELHMERCPEIQSFPEGGLPLNLKELDIYGCSKLLAAHRHWDLQSLTSLDKLSIRQSDVVLDSFPEGLLPISLTDFTIEHLPHLKSLNNSAFLQVKALRKLSLYGCKELHVLPEQVLCSASLHSLFIVGCPILEQRYRREKGEDWHKISYIPELYFGGLSSKRERRL